MSDCATQRQHRSFPSRFVPSRWKRTLRQLGDRHECLLKLENLLPKQHGYHSAYQPPDEPPAHFSRHWHPSWQVLMLRHPHTFLNRKGFTDWLVVFLCRNTRFLWIVSNRKRIIEPRRGKKVTSFLTHAQFLTQIGLLSPSRGIPGLNWTSVCMFILSPKQAFFSWSGILLFLSTKKHDYSKRS